MRAGNPLVDWLDGYLRRDEGGRAWAVWRSAEDAADPSAFFRVDLVLEFDEALLPDMPAGVTRRLRRRGDAFLPPRVETVWLGDEGEVDSIFVTDRLDPSSPTDQQLRGPLWIAALRRFPNWPTRCEELKERALEAVHQRRDVVHWREGAVKQARTDLDRRRRVLAAWIERLPSGPERDHADVEYRAELGLDTAIEAGIASPRAVIIAAGAVLMAREALVA